MARPPVPCGARQQQRFVWALGDAPGTAPTTASDSGKGSAVGNVFAGAIGTGLTLPGGSAARRAESSFRGSVEAGGPGCATGVSTPLGWVASA